MTSNKNDWSVLAKQIHDELNEIQRDALLPYVISKTDGIKNPQDLYEKLLIDVEMGSCGSTSRVQEAIAAVQLYFHRYFVNLETPDVKGGNDQATREELKKWWKWMKNYRVWEANRKVFLYPENYIRPELRDTKTSAFKTLEEDLLQGEITEESAQRAFKKYLDEYTEVSRLTIAGGYVYSQPGADSGDRHLVLFGRTKTDPKRYYYRLAEFMSDSTWWHPWLSVNVQIDADKVYPVFAFNRVFVFWAGVETLVQGASSTKIIGTTTSQVTETTVSADSQQVTYCIKIFYSFYNLNKEWVVPQQLESDQGFSSGVIQEKSQIESVRLFVENSEKLILQNETASHENIVITCIYKVKGGNNEKTEAFSLTPELYTKEADKPGISNNGKELFETIFDEPEINEKNIVLLNTSEKSSDGPWFSFDHKGGSFLCKPDIASISSKMWPREIFKSPNSDKKEDKKNLGEDLEVRDIDDWNRLHHQEDKAFLAFLWKWYLKIQSDQPPKSKAFDSWFSGLAYQFISTRGAGWQKLDAAVQIPEGTIYLFNEQEYVTIDKKRTVSAKQSIRDRWGRVRTNIATDGRVDAAFFDGEKSYLFSGNEYLVYSKNYDRSTDFRADIGYPKRISDNNENLPKWDKIDAAFRKDTKNYFFDNTKQVYVTYDIKTKQLSREQPIQNWGRSREPENIFTRVENLSQRILIDAAFVLDDATYLITKTQFLKYQGKEYDLAVVGYPKDHTFHAVLADLGCQNNQDSYNERRVLCAHNVNSEVHFVTIALRDNFEEVDPQLHVFNSSNNLVEGKGASDRWTAAFAVNGVHYRFKDGKLFVNDLEPIDSSRGIHAAFVGTDDQIYLFKKQDYISFPKASVSQTQIITQIQQWDANSQQIRSKWGKIAKIIGIESVDAAFCENNKIHLFSGDRYFVYANDDLLIEPGYPKSIRENQDNLPLWDKVDAVLTTGVDGKKYFFNDDKYAESSDLRTLKSTKEQWGHVSLNNFTNNGKVDAAYTTTNHQYLFLISGNQFIRYTLASQQKPGDFIDIGYPRFLDLSKDTKQIDAVFWLDNQLYLFANGQYVRLEAGQEPSTLGAFTNIQGNWGNLPYEFRASVDAALSQGDTLYLFKGKNYIQYQLSKVKPYLIKNVKYEIVRLTSSTAYKLNQQLLAGGVSTLLSQDTQEIDDIPAFKLVDSNSSIKAEAAATTIKVKAGKVQADKLPMSLNLDFDSANGLYYWEIFFHAPFLIAQSLNTEQKFAEAKSWYEYIFDPTGQLHHWQFLPFQPLGRVFSSILDNAKAELDAVGPQETASDAQISGKGNVFDRIRRIFNWVAERAGALQRDLELSEADERFVNDWLKSDNSNNLGNLRLEISRESNPGLFDFLDFVEKLAYRYKIRQNRSAQIKSYLNDPFDPHAIAAFRHIAYQKAIIMAYIDNLIDWGDGLFRQYTPESINEARMLYMLAYDILGSKPDHSGRRILSETKSYSELGPLAEEGSNQQIAAATPPDPLSLELKYLKDEDDDYDFLVYPKGTVHDSVLNPYFYIPANETLTEYWERVADRLYKIRCCLDIEGISQPLPLFEPPINPMALVQAASSGIGFSATPSSLTVAVPHYRFSFMVRKAQELVAKLSQFGSDLLNTLEKKDAEELSLLQNRQESIILNKTREIKRLQIEEAGHQVAALNESLAAANQQVAHYAKLIKDGLMPTEIAQIALMVEGSRAMLASGIGKMLSAIAWANPKITLGPFSAGVTTGGDHIGEAIDKTTEAMEVLGDGLSMVGEVLGISAQYQRTVQDWKFQRDMAESDVRQITAQIAGAKLQQESAQWEMEILEKEIEHNESVKTFMQGKFANAQLYQWMASRMSGLYYQTYQMAYDMAKAAEKAFQFERGLPESQVNYINGIYWDSQKKGLMAGDILGVDLDRMEKAFLDTDRRGFEISKNISMLELDPVAFLKLKSTGVCEFALTEALFDYDFPGHYCRQIKTISLTFDAGEGQTVLATLTQLNHKTVLEPDPKAVKFLLDPKDQPPLTIRYNWRSNQQIALSYVDQYGTNNGLFELRFDDERYFPFEGTGAVSTWRLELNGKKGSYNPSELLDITINLKYTAEQGDAGFVKAVKGMLKPYPTVRFFDMHYDFPEEWQAFLKSDSNELVLPFTRDQFPNMGSSKISGIYTQFDLEQPGEMSMTLNYQDNYPMRNGQYLLTPGLTVSNRGSRWVLTIKGDKQNLRNINLVVGYQATVT